MTGIASNSTQAHAHAARDRLWMRVGALLVLIIAFVLSLIAFLNYSNYRKTLTELNQSRYLVVAKDLRQAISLGLDAGLQPSENAQLLAIMADAIRKHDGIRYIAVVDDAGNEMVQGSAGDGARQAWRAWYPKAEADRAWYARESGNGQVGLPFFNNFRLKAGAVIVGYDRQVIDRQVRQMGERLAGDAALTLAAFAVITLVGVQLLSRTFVRKIDHVAGVIDSALSEGAPTQLEEHWLDSETSGAINEFVATTHGVAADIAALERLTRAAHDRPLGAA